MAKRVKPCPGWLATFADLMSLLMAVFVLLFAMSTLDAEKYESVVQSLTNALGHGQDLTQTQVQYFKQVQKNQSDSDLSGETVIENLKPLYESLIETYLSEAKPSEDIKINFDPQKNQIKVTFAEQISFSSGQAELMPKLIFQLRKLKVYLNPDMFVRAVGHTDELPVTGGRFRSNWELSSARAAAVIEQLVLDSVILPEQGEAVGMADTQPISAEHTPEAHAKNRRVEIIIMPKTLR
ncbi:OmpA/MotB family protein [Thiosulfativibrio zosterae]|uniref:OmpA-like domain-containing protein n=1 Tax=Thiosulfativibrio zosterae TaxID=2675053 RepID=A0A6F8PPS7_9GAMM|nr:flagellar motor protein MotB [Thiosulfativibrio zosterae]BBP44038.1 hypothetical protein THMIRHAT_17840 [Thiosulfativibrio zosterae]